MGSLKNEILKTDVCIVGAGPSGTASALMLSKLKIKHLLIDKAIFPRDKTCGDGLILYAYKAMKTIDENLLKAFFENPKFLHSKSIKLHISNNHNINFKETPDRGSVISYAKRLDFDNFLVEQLDENFTQKFFGDEVKKVVYNEDGVLLTLKSEQQIQTKIVVGADGIQSVISKKLAKNKIDRNKMSTFINAYYEGVENLPLNKEAEIRVCYNKIPLFFYVFPLADGQVNVSLGGNTAKIQQFNINLKEALEDILCNHPKVNYKFKNAKKIGNWRGWGIPYSFSNQKLSGNHFILVGDAAGLANSFYKEGVGTGMMSGIYCANQIKKCLDNENFSASFLKPYDKKLHQEFGKLLKFSETALRFSYKKSLFSITTKLMKKYVERKSIKMILKRSY